MQELVVGLIVAYAAWSVAARYAPKALTRNARKLLARTLKRLGLKQAADYFGKSSQGEDCADGCGSCGGCGSTSRKGASSPGQSSITPDALRRTAHHRSSGVYKAP